MRRSQPTSRAGQLSTLVAAGAITTGGMLPPMLVGALAVQMRRDLDFSNTQLGAAVAAYFLFSSAQSVQAGAWNDRVGTRRALAAAGASSVVCLLSIVLIATSYPLLVVTLLIGTLAASVSTPASNALVISNIPVGRQGLAHGVKQAAIPTASLLAGLAVPVVALTIGWRWAFGICALVPAIGVLAVWDSAPHVALEPDRRERPSRGRLSDVRLGPVAMLAAGAGMCGGAVTSLTSFVVVASTEAGMSEGVAGGVVAIASAFVIAIRIGIGHSADRRLGDRLLAVAAMQFVAALGFFMLAPGHVWLMAIGTTVALALGWGWTGLFTLAVVEFHPRNQGVATGIAMTGVYAGAVVGPLLFALIEDRSSFRSAWIFAGLMTIGAAAAVIVARSRLLLANNEQ